MNKREQITALLAAKQRALELWPSRWCIADAMSHFKGGSASLIDLGWRDFTFDKDGWYFGCSSNWVRDNWPNKELVAAVFDNSIFNIKYGHAPWDVGK